MLERSTFWTVSDGPTQELELTHSKIRSLKGMNLARFAQTLKVCKGHTYTNELCSRCYCRLADLSSALLLMLDDASAIWNTYRRDYHSGRIS